ncbi:FtsK/SpoIIIE domain-containing protein [Streptomyces sp. URMC 129]|uniref:FtsK/SpoIIIE domain-containing protein n=1 Tax=Streptomyces sp. URMC 129 TaxID=3423407 RepID=UPI003F199D72
MSTTHDTDEETTVVIGPWLSPESHERIAADARTAVHATENGIADLTTGTIRLDKPEPADGGPAAVEGVVVEQLADDDPRWRTLPLLPESLTNPDVRRHRVEVLRNRAGFHAIRTPVYLWRAARVTGVGARVALRDVWSYQQAGEYGEMIDQARRKGLGDDHVAALRKERREVAAARHREPATVLSASASTSYVAALVAIAQVWGVATAAPVLLPLFLTLFLLGRREIQRRAGDGPVPGIVLDSAQAAAQLLEEGGAPLTEARLREAIHATKLASPADDISLVGLVKSYPATETRPAATEVVADLPKGAEAKELAKKKGVIASALSIGAGQIDLEFFEKNARRFSLYISDDLPFTGSAVAPGPLMELVERGGEFSIFDRIPVGVSVRGVDQYIPRLVGRSMLLGGEPEAGKSVAAFCVLLAAVLDPLVGLWLVDGKGVGGNLKRLAHLAERYDDTTDPEVFEEILDDLRAEMQRRYRRLNSLGEEKVTPELVAKHPDLYPLLFFIDELKEYTANFDEKTAKRLTQKLISLVSLARGAGIITVACTQKPSSDVVKTSLRDLLGVRWALRCATPQASDTILPGKSAQGFGGHLVSALQRGAGFLDVTGLDAVFLRSYLYVTAHIVAIVEHATRLRAKAGTLPETEAETVEDLGLVGLLLEVFERAGNPDHLKTAEVLAGLARLAPEPWAAVADLDARTAGRKLREALADALPAGRELAPVERGWGRGYLLADTRAAAGIAPE